MAVCCNAGRESGLITEDAEGRAKWSEMSRKADPGNKSRDSCHVEGEEDFGNPEKIL